MLNKIKMPVKINYAYYIFFDNFAGLVYFNVPLNNDKHGPLVTY